MAGARGGRSRGARMFVAVRPDPEAIEHFDDFLDVRRAVEHLRWTRGDQFHVTLAFTESVADHDIDEYAERLGQAAAKRKSLTARIAGGGCFPNPARAKVLYARLQLEEDGRAELERLAIGARNAAVATGIEVAGDRFRPHVTVARTARPRELSNWVRLLDSYAGPVWTIGEVELVASYLGEGPRKYPRHEVVASFPLG
ncbi:MAG: RNA 2',3'-cyclic phosphodiesterase [Nocardioides sp.]